MEKINIICAEDINSEELKILSMTHEELNEYQRDKSHNVYSISLAHTVMSEMHEGRSTTIEKLRERHFGSGKAIQKRIIR